MTGLSCFMLLASWMLLAASCCVMRLYTKLIVLSLRFLQFRNHIFCFSIDSMTSLIESLALSYANGELEMALCRRECAL